MKYFKYLFVNIYHSKLVCVYIYNTVLHCYLLCWTRNFLYPGLLLGSESNKNNNYLIKSFIFVLISVTVCKGLDSQALSGYIFQGDSKFLFVSFLRA
jgi:hypothetical protein